MRIVHVVRQFSPAIGGIEDFVMQLATRQVAAGHEVRVVTLDRVFHDPEQRTLPAYEVIRGIEVVRIPFTGSTRYPLAAGVLKHLGGADLVHVHAVDFFFDFLALTRALHRKPLVVSTHGGFFHTDAQAGLKKLYFNSITRATIRAYRAVFPSSLSDEKTFARIRRQGLIAIENGVDVDKFAGLARPEAKRIIYFGRLAPHKGIVRLLDWFAALQKIDPEWRLVIAGKPMGVAPDGLMRRAADLAIADRIEVHAAPSDSELADLISTSSIYACASEYEGFGLAAVEAAAAGLYPVLSDIPAFRRTIAQLKFGELSTFQRDSDAITTILRNWEQWKAADRALLLAEVRAKFGWDGVADAFEDAYRKCLQKQGAPS